MSSGEPLPTAELFIGRAEPTDDAELRRLMRETAMEGSVRLAFAREPSFFHAAGVEGETETIVAREPSGRVVALFSRSVRACWVAGEPRKLAYLSALRIAPEYRFRRSLLRAGFGWVRRLQEADSAQGALPYAITTIVSDNAPAKRLLEAGLPGLPRYQPLTEMVTLAAPTWRVRYRPVPGLEVRQATEADQGEIVAALGRWGRRHAFCPVWSEATLSHPERCRDLALTDFVLACRKGRVVGCVALWDQQSFKQSLVHGYQGALGWVRRGVNVAAPVLGLPRLPEPGEPLRHAYLSHLAVDGDDADAARAVVGFAHDLARPRAYGYLTTMLASGHPLLPALQRLLRPLEYRSTLYLASWSERLEAPTALPHLEVAVL